MPCLSGREFREEPQMRQNFRASRMSLFIAEVCVCVAGGVPSLRCEKKREKGKRIL